MIRKGRLANHLRSPAVPNVRISTDQCTPAPEVTVLSVTNDLDAVWRIGIRHAEANDNQRDSPAHQVCAGCPTRGVGLA